MGKQPAYVENSNIGTDPSQMYAWDDANAKPSRLGSIGDSIKCIDGDIVWDQITPIFNATSDVYQFYLSMVLQKTITVSYTDATKAVMSSVTKV